MKYRYIKITYSNKTNPEVMAFQLLVRNYTTELKKYNIKIKYTKERLTPFKVQLYDRQGKLQYETNDYRRLKFIIKKVGFLKDESDNKTTK
jgi:outer membrane lipoprotein-sorting protein